MPHDVPRLELEQFALGQLAPERAAALQQLADADPELSARMQRVQKDIRRAERDMPALVLPQDALDTAPGRPWWMFALPLPLLAAAVALFVLAVPPTTPEVTWRGDLELQVWRVRLGEAQEQGALIEARSGDRIQYQVEAGEDGWLAVYDVQDDGLVSTFLEPVQVAAREPFEGAVQLDDFQGSERIYFVVSPEPLRQVQIEAAVEAAWDQPIHELDDLPGLPEGLSQRSVLVVKP